MAQWFGDTTLWALGEGMYATSMRHQVLLHNIANVETPRYQRQDITFRDQLRRALGRDGAALSLSRTQRGHLPGRHATVQGGRIRPRNVVQPGDSLRPDGNTVSLDQEMSLLAQNALE